MFGKEDFYRSLKELDEAGNRSFFEKVDTYCLLTGYPLNVLLVALLEDYPHDLTLQKLCS